nr:hypothetical protein BaRGS_023592 [Batillaria attramentaria]
MKRTAEEEASRLSDVLCFGTSGDVTAAIEALADEELYEACTSIMANGHTIVHVLTQRQKVPSLQAVLKRGVDVNTRNAQVSVFCKMPDTNTDGVV